MAHLSLDNMDWGANYSVCGIYNILSKAGHKIKIEKETWKKERKKGCSMATVQSHKHSTISIDSGRKIPPFLFNSFFYPSNCWPMTSWAINRNNPTIVASELWCEHLTVLIYTGPRLWMRLTRCGNGWSVHVTFTFLCYCSDSPHIPYLHQSVTLLVLYHMVSTSLGI